MRLSCLILVCAAACGPVTGSLPSADLGPLRAADTGYAASRFVGQRTDGAACADDRQCQSGLCSATVSACGVCLTRRFLGESCGGAGQACSPSAQCVGGTCVTAKKGFGAECAVLPKGGDVGECDDELVCLSESFKLGRCVAPSPVGAACKEWPNACRAGTRCVDGTCTVYVPDAPVRGPVLAAGARCGLDPDVGRFIDGECADGTTCGNLQFPNGGGGPGTVSTCVPLPTEGQAAVLYRCAAGLYAEYTDGQDPLCKPLLPLGAICSRDICAAGLECRHGLCAPVCQ